MAVADEPSAPAARPPRRVAVAAALTSVAQAVAMAIGGVLAILIAARFGTSAQTDGFFAAYGVYGLIVLVAQSSRLTLVSRMVGAQTRFGGFDAYLSAAALMWLAAGVVLVALGDPLAQALTASEPAHATARTSLAILWVAAAGQLFASLAAAMQGVLGDFTRAAFGYMAGGIATVIAFLVLASSLDVDAVPVAVACGTAITVLPLAHGLWSAGWRPAWHGPLRTAFERAGRFVVGAVAIAIPQALYLISMAFAAGLGTGFPTVYSYAFFGVGIVIAVVASSVSIVLAAPVAAAWDRRPASLRPHVDATFRAGLLLLAPILAAAALIGSPVAQALLSGFSEAQADKTIETFLMLSPAILAAQATAVPLIAVYTQDRFRAIALLAPPVLLAHLGLSALAVALDGLLALAGAASVSALGFAGGVLWLLHGRATARETAHLVAETLRLGVPAAACFGLPALVLGGLPALLVGLVLYVLMVALVLPEHRALTVRLIRPGR